MMKRMFMVPILLGVSLFLSSCGATDPGQLSGGQTLAETRPLLNLPENLSGETIELSVPAAILNMAEYYNLQITDIYGLTEPIQIDSEGTHHYRLDKAIYDQYEKVLMESVLSTLENITIGHAYIRSIDYSAGIGDIQVFVDAVGYNSAGIRDIYQTFYITVIYQAFVAPVSETSSLRIEILNETTKEALGIIYLPEITSEYLSAF